MASNPAVLLKRSDGPHFRVHIGNDYEAVAEALSTQQAFSVSPALICPRSSLDTADSVRIAIQTLCKHLYNSCFHAPSTDIAAVVLLQALNPTFDPEVNNTQGENPNCTESTPNSPQIENVQTEIPNCTESSSGLEVGSEQAQVTHRAESCSGENLDGRLWYHVVASCASDASKAAEVRTVLVQKLGKTDAKQILKSCVAAVAQDGHGRKHRVLEADGKLLKLRPGETL